MQGQKALGFHQKYLNLCSKERSYRFGTKASNFHFWVNCPFNDFERRLFCLLNLHLFDINTVKTVIL